MMKEVNVLSILYIRMDMSLVRQISFLQSIGAVDVQVQFKETGWWLGRYDKDTKRFERKEEAGH